jgi:hypothetical protein
LSLPLYCLSPQSWTMRNNPQGHHLQDNVYLTEIFLHDQPTHKFSTLASARTNSLWKKFKQLILMITKLIQVQCVLYASHCQNTSVYITFLHRIVQFSLPQLSLCLKEFYLLISQSSDLSKPAKLITHIVCRPPSWVRKPEHVASMKTYIPSRAYRQTLDWFNRFISWHVLSCWKTRWVNKKFWEERTIHTFL